MGYFVDGVCVSNLEHAEALLYSKVAPILTSNGVQQIYFVDGKYIYQGQILVSSFPPCSVSDSFIAGASLALIIGLFFMIAFGFIALKRVM